MPTRGQLKAELPSAEALKAELMKKSMDGYIRAEEMISPWKFGVTGPEQAAARQHILNVTLTPENRALIEKIKTVKGIDDEKTRLKAQMKAVIEDRSLAAEAIERMASRYTYGTGGRKTRKSKKTRKNRKTRSRRI